uniref:Uncharacterized protein n=1 Tax=Oryza glumipatula TaxID=40148 RepID=A0A0D9ZY93_9ORYZ
MAVSRACPAMPPETPAAAARLVAVRGPQRPLRETQRPLHETEELPRLGGGAPPSPPTSEATTVAGHSGGRWQHQSRELFLCLLDCLPDTAYK